MSQPTQLVLEQQDVNQAAVLTVPVVVELKCRFCPKMPATIDTKANITVMMTTICRQQPDLRSQLNMCMLRESCS